MIAACHGGAGHTHAEPPAAEDERPVQSFTLWTERHELFSENPALVVGHGSKFAAHVTLVPSFAAAAKGRVTLTLVQADGSTVTARTDAPRIPGIFGPVLAPRVAGKCTLSALIETEGAPDRVAFPECRVFATLDAASEALGGDEDDAGATVPFLKEQQWKTEFAMAAVNRRALQGGVRATGELRVPAGKEVRVTSAVPGRLVLADPAPVLGQAVARGARLATVIPRMTVGGDRASIEADVLTSRAELAAAGPRLARARRLAKDDLVSKTEVDHWDGAVRVAQARLAGAEARLAQYERLALGGGGLEAPGGLDVLAPIGGTLVSAGGATGQVVQDGDALFTIMDLSTVWLEARVFETDLGRLGTPGSAWFTAAGEDAARTSGRLITVGHVVDPETRTVPVIFEVPNADGRLRVGQFCRVTIAAGPPIDALAVPESAIVRDAGKAVVYVQSSGEAFERRAITTGLKSLGWVEVKDGLKSGERVVTRGAWEIKLSSAAGSVPAHGHVH